MEFTKKFRIPSDCKISISVHHWFIPLSGILKQLQYHVCSLACMEV